MLYQVILLCTAIAAPSAPVKLQPQFDADGDDELKEKLDKWLVDTGYQLVEGTTPEVTPLEVDGAPAPTTGVAEVDALLGEASTTINELRARNQELENTIAATLEAPSKIALLHDKVLGIEGQLNEAIGELSKSKAEHAETVRLLNAETQKVADRDSTIATLTARIDALVADAPKPANGETPAP